MAIPFITDEAELRCPHCDGLNLHQGTVEVFNPRNEDDLAYPITVTHNDIIRGGDPARNPSSRRQAIVIYFMCETCGDPERETLALAIQQHKGTTYVKWIELPSPITDQTFSNL